MAMRFLTAALGVALAIFATAALAEPIPAVGPWVDAFTKAALANDPDAMLTESEKIVHPQFPMETLKNIYGKIHAIVGTQPGDHAEQFDEAHVGTFMRRVNIAVHYPTRYLYYSLTFLRNEAGWQLAGVDWNTDVNEVFKLTWPH